MHTGREIHAVVMPAEGDDFAGLVRAGNGCADVLACAVIAFAGQLDMHRLCAAADDFSGGGGAHVQHGNRAEWLRQRFAQLAAVQVTFALAVSRAPGEGQNGRGFRLAQLFVGRAVQIAVHKHNFALRLFQQHFVGILDIQELRVQTAFGGGGSALVARDLVLLDVGRRDPQQRVRHAPARNGKLLQLGGNAERRAFVQQRFGDSSLLLGTADALIAVSAQEGKGAVGRYVHEKSLLL